ncbi:hypothetical protein BX600DRAFT_437397 [Xylariales sp. PMI_506]|nr:hypothetical protein BX600DRAFT_437397 [Xylariales sp. PMI_506]
MRIVNSAIIYFSFLPIATSAESPICVGQGMGSCQGVYWCADPLSSTGLECQFLVYDYACDILGETRVCPDPDDSFWFKNLKQPIIIKQLESSTDYTVIYVIFEYSNVIYGPGWTNNYAADCTEEISRSGACGFMRVAFDC